MRATYSYLITQRIFDDEHKLFISSPEIFQPVLTTFAVDKNIILSTSFASIFYK
jgi:hypothetical protein